MEAQVVNAPSVASHDETVRCLLAIELSKKSWIVAVNTPLSDKISRYTLKPCDGKELLDLCERIRTRVARETGKRVEIVSCSKLATTASGSTVCSRHTASATTSSTRQVCRLIVGHAEPRRTTSIPSECSDQ